VGNTFSVNVCTGTGIDSCSYICGANGTYTLQQCQRVGNNMNRRFEYCDYNAGCPVSGGYLQGKLTTVAQLCTQNGVQQTVVATAACGGVCSRKLVCRPGQPCKGGEEPKTCKWKSGVGELVPTCSDTGSGYTCTFGSLTLSVPKPCPTVSRTPFPRAIVSKPVRLTANVCGNLPSATGKQDVPEPWDDCGDTVVAYEGAMAWQCSAQGGVNWTMDERSWNVGQTGSDGRKILNQRSGTVVSHVYETSSYDLMPNGPGVNLTSRQPAYQVSLQTKYSLMAQFRYHHRTQEERCYWGANQSGGRKQCHNPGACLSDPNRANREDCKPDGSRETVIITPTRDLPAMVIPDVTVTGAKVPQDPVLGNTCGPVPIPVIQVQSVLLP
jgi:hypothetical protein